MDAQHTPIPTETLVTAAEVDGADPVLAQGGSAHDAWFDGHVEVGLAEDAGGVVLEKLRDGKEFGVAGSLHGESELPWLKGCSTPGRIEKETV